MDDTMTLQERSIESSVFRSRMAHASLGLTHFRSSALSTAAPGVHAISAHTMFLPRSGTETARNFAIWWRDVILSCYTPGHANTAISFHLPSVSPLAHTMIEADCL